MTQAYKGYARLFQTHIARIEIAIAGIVASVLNAYIGTQLEATWHERTYETKAYEFGDPFNLDIQRTVRNAIARFNQVKDVSDAERDAAWKRIKAAAKKFDVTVHEQSWRDIGKG